MRKKFHRKKGRKHVQSHKTEYDGITFASGLEVHMYKVLKEASLFDKYEGERFLLMEGFPLVQNSYERQANGKGEFKNRNTSAIRKITYTPDFTGKDYIIETKGRANESFPIRWKLFKRTLTETRDTRALYKPQTQKECDEVIQLILNARKDAKKN